MKSPSLEPLPDPLAALFPSMGERHRIEERLTGELERALRRIQAGPVAPTVDMTAFREELRAYDFGTPRPLDQLLSWTVERMEHGIVQMANPRYFGLFNPGASFPAQCADRIAALFNPQLASSASSPVPVELERHVVHAVARRAALDDTATGHFATGGSEANYTSLLCALTAAHPRFAGEGARAFAGPIKFYTSRDCHIAWLKIAHQTGVGRSALRLVDTDGRGRMDPAALRRAIAEDRAAGAVPVMVAATAGTTGGGMIDPLHACADIAAAEHLWLHVDAAWGGAVLASDRLRGLLAGIERADSMTIDAHKWLATTMGCALFLTRHGSTLSEAFHASTSFMPSSIAGVDPYLNSVQWSRRFLGLRLFLALAAAGWEGLGAHVERSVEVVERIKERLVGRGWTVANDSPLAVLDVLPPRETRRCTGLGAPGGGFGAGLGRRRGLRGARCGAHLRHERRNPCGGCRCSPRHSQPPTLTGFALAQNPGHQRFDGRHRMEILRRDIRRGNADIELDFDGQHQVHHFERADSEIAQLQVDGKRDGYGGTGPEKLLDEHDELRAHALMRLRVHSIHLQRATSPSYRAARSRAGCTPETLKVLHLLKKIERSVTKSQYCVKLRADGTQDDASCAVRGAGPWNG